jgi:hypothetical protein
MQENVKFADVPITGARLMDKAVFKEFLIEIVRRV